MPRPNKITGANAGGPRQWPMRTRWAARVGLPLAITLVMRYIALAFLLTLLTGCSFRSKQHRDTTDPSHVASGAGSQAQEGREAVLAVVNGVTVLDFHTDRPVRQARLVVDGQIVDTTGAGNTKAGLQVAVVHGAADVTVHLQVPQMGWLLRGAYRPWVRADVGQRERFGPGKQLTLGDWTEGYGIKQQVARDGKVLYTLSVQVR